MSFAQRFSRLARIVCVLGLEYRSLRRHAPGASLDSAAQRFTKRLLRLGPVFVKLGQVLSTRPDFLPPPYIDALSALQENAPPLSIDQIRNTIQREFGEPVDALFASFDIAPVAAASLAQVHRATLPDGTAVAVKVQRPDLERLIARDLDAIEAGIRMLYRVSSRRMRRTNLLAFFLEFKRYTLQELDFAHEAQVIDRFRKNFEHRNEVRFPNVHWSHTRRRVLTMGWLSGERLAECVGQFADEDKQRVAVRLIDALLQMFVSDGFFHADLHPGNILFHRDGTFTLLDFGMSGELTDEQRDRFILYLFAVVQRQTRRAFHHLKIQTRALPGADEEAFFDRFRLLADEFYVSRLSEVSFAKVYLQMMVAGYECGFVFPSEVMLHAKALTTAEALVHRLAPDARFEELARPFIAREYAARTVSFDLLGRRLSQLVPELALLGEFLPPRAIDANWDHRSSAALFTELRQHASGALRRSIAAGGFWRSIVEPHLRAVLGETSLASSIDAVLGNALKRYDGLESSLDVEANLGAVFTTHAAAFTLALHESMVAQGLPVADSHRLLFDIGWRIYLQMAEPPLLVAGAFTKDPRKRLKIATNLFRTFPFGAPSYRWRDVAVDDDSVAFDYTRCPVAEFFAAHDAAELCVQTFCRLDFPLAERWGGELVRTGTLASGAERCDFRWVPMRRFGAQFASSNGGSAPTR